MEMLHIWQSVPESKYTFVVSLSRSLVLSFFRFFVLCIFVLSFFHSFFHFSRMFHSFFIPNSVILSISSFFLVLFPRFFYKPKGRLFKRSVSYKLFTAYKIDDYCSSVGS